jgi:hypothetical protein
MSKVITSPVQRFPGTVTLPDFLTFPQAIAWEEASREAEALKKDGAVAARSIQAWTKGITAVVQEWNLTGFSVEPFQSTPRAEVVRLCSWLIDEITRLYEDTDAIPND